MRVWFEQIRSNVSSTCICFLIKLLFIHVPFNVPVRLFFVWPRYIPDILSNWFYIHMSVIMIAFCASITSSRTERALSGHSCQPKLLKLVCCLHTRVSLLLLKGPSSQISLQILAKNCLPFLLSRVHLQIICLTCFAIITFTTLLNAFLRYLFTYNSWASNNKLLYI